MPLFRVTAGFPSAADDFLEQPLDLHAYLIQNPPATFLKRVKGDSMEGAGIFSGDILIVDRSLSPESGKVVVVCREGQMLVKRFQKKKNGVLLVSENKAYPPISVSPQSDVTIWGVVTAVIHKP